MLADGGPVMCEVVVNVLWCLARMAAGEPSITPALIERCWDERRGLFLDVARGKVAHRARHRPGRPATTASVPRPGRPSRRWLFPTSPRRSAAGWSRSTCSTPPATGLPYPPPSVSPQEPSFEPRDWQRLAGPPLLARADLDQLGLADLARAAAARLRGRGARDWPAPSARTYVREGSREFYEPFTGEGLGAREFGWSTLIAELADPDPAAAVSHLG